MSTADLQELLMLWLFIPINLVTVALCIASGLYVYIDSHERSQSRKFAAILAILASLVYWPISVVAYMLVTISIDKRAKSQSTSQT